jgi:glycosyltransferase involved in cell wall biosynthesis
MKQPLVSVVVPTRNRPDYLAQTLKSISEQTYKNIEIIVVDDGSKINYAESICKYFDNCTYYYKDNGGLSSARNFGIQKSLGEYIAFLDDDDLWKPEKIERQVNILRENKDINLVHSPALVIDEHGRETGQIIGASAYKIHKRSGYVFWNALSTWVVKSPTPLIRRTSLINGLLFDESIMVGEDVDFYQRYFYRNKIYYFPEPLAYYRDYKNSSRLSTQQTKYLGIESKMMINFQKMRVSHVHQYFIALKLIKSAQKRHRLLKCPTLYKTNLFSKYFSPIKYLINNYKY